MSYKFVEKGGVLQVVKGVLVVMKVKLSNGLYYLQNSLTKGYVASVKNVDVSCSNGNSSNLLKLWHLRLRHMSYEGIKELNNQGLLGFKLKINQEFCETCVMGKQTRAKFITGQYAVPAIWDYIHSNF